MATDIFMVIFGPGGQMQGESTDVVFKNAIEIDTFSMDAQNLEEDVRTKAAEARAGQVQKAGAWSDEMDRGGGDDIEDTDAAGGDLDQFTFEIEKDVDRSSPALFQNFCKVKSQLTENFDRILIYLCIAGQERNAKLSKEAHAHVVLEFMDVHVVSYSLSLDADRNTPTETVEFYFGKYKITYRKQSEAGKLIRPRSVGWDFENNKPL
jgi:type VI protein secretion system component Hcp